MSISDDAIKRIKEKVYEPYIAKNNVLLERVQNETLRDRPPYQRDYTRILYSSAFRRLQGKMQLLGVNSTNFFRNRLTHSLEVCQIARSIAEAIGYSQEDVYVVEACSLAHDIGNPPFGHYGEIILDQLVRNKSSDIANWKIEGFEGNAQTLRVLTTLQSKKPQCKGMNLTYRTLLGVAKYMYPVERPCKGKYLYRDDYKLLNEFVRKNNLPHKTIDAQIMDISDEIAYAAHDLEDTLNQRVFTISEFIHELENELSNNRKLKPSEVTEVIEFVNKELVHKAYEAVGKSYCDQYHTLFTKELGSLIINRLIQDLDAVESECGDFQIGFNKLGHLCSAIKKVTFNCLTHTSEIQRYEKKGEIIITDLFNFFFDNTKFMPIEYKDMLKDDIITNSRVVCDYIAGMMDEYATEVHQNIFGSKFFETHGISKSYYFDKGINNE